MYRATITSGTAIETLDYRQYKLPGRGVPPDSTHQFVEGEYMKADEYDALLDNPEDYIFRTYIPRVYGALEAFKQLPPLRSFLSGFAATAGFTVPEVAAAFETFFKAGRELTRTNAVVDAFEKEMAKLGFPSAGGGGVSAPFDRISDFLRGMRGSMLDMYRQPDKLLRLLQGEEKLLLQQIKTIVSNARKGGNPRVFMPLHRGADGFMSPKQFETFYWPGLKKVITTLVDGGLTPLVFFEGSYDQRLEHLRELPKGKVVAWFDKTDVFKAKEIIGDTVCIMGNMPSSMLSVGTPQEVKDYSKKLIDIVGDGGGFIMSGGTATANANPELVKLWMDYTKEYGVYNR
jgi:uroporphyrinogen-III decarboxylase